MPTSRGPESGSKGREDIAYSPFVRYCSMVRSSAWSPLDSTGMDRCGVLEMLSYYKRVGIVMWKDFRSSVRAQMIGAFLAIAILVFQDHYGLIKQADVRANFWSIAWPYALLVLGLFGAHLAKAPKKLDDQR